MVLVYVHVCVCVDANANVSVTDFAFALGTVLASVLADTWRQARPFLYLRQIETSAIAAVAGDIAVGAAAAVESGMAGKMAWGSSSRRFPSRRPEQNSRWCLGWNSSCHSAG